ncbi:MAG: acyl-CoA dehydrogenase, partial [Acidimicrobiaceae bacterium]|nr:acyl-CoA dehydrogenase [Acidimicrobiaceae bacterium]
MDLTWSAAQERTRLELRKWLEHSLAGWRAEIGTERSGDTREGFAQQLLWERRLYEADWSAVSWPRAYGGRDGTLWDWLIFEEEYWRAGAPQRVTQNGLQILAPSVFEHGNQEQKDLLLPRIKAGQDLWCQGWSEPNAGSDLAGVSSRARRVDGGWVLDGQKT